MLKSVSFYLLAFVFAFPSAQGQQNGNIHIYGKIENVDGAVYLADIGELGELSPLDETYRLPLNAQNEFEITLASGYAGYYRVGFNELYLEPGDSIHVLIDLSDPSLARFNGRGATKQEYLTTAPFARSGSFLAGGLQVKEGYSETLEHVISLSKNRRSVLDGTRNISERFKALEQARIRADLINSFKMAPSYYYRVHDFPQDSIVAHFQAYKDIADGYIKKYAVDFADTRFLALASYRQIISVILPYSHTDEKAISRLKEWEVASRVFQGIVRGTQSNDSVALDNLAANIEEIESLPYKKVLENSFLALTKFKVGEQAINVEIIDAAGHFTNLSDYRGHVIYIDFWATWCAPCIEERPYFQELGRKHNEDKIIFLSLSIDRDHQKWKNFLASSDSTFTVEGLVDLYKLPAYNVVHIPRYVLIDQHFNVIDFNAPKPSSADAPQLLQQLL